MIETNFFVAYVGNDGGVDQERKLEAQRLLARTRADSQRRHEDTVIDITCELSRKRYDRQFQWAPTGKEAARFEREIERILGIVKR